MPALPKTVTGKTQRGLLQASLEGKAALCPARARTAVADAGAYAACHAAAQRWRYSRARLRVPLPPSTWRRLGVDGHDVGGSPVLPAAGWLCLLRDGRVRRAGRPAARGGSCGASATPARRWF